MTTVTPIIEEAKKDSPLEPIEFKYVLNKDGSWKMPGLEPNDFKEIKYIELGSMIKECTHLFVCWGDSQNGVVTYIGFLNDGVVV